MMVWLEENKRKERKLQRKLEKERIQREIEETIRVIQGKIERWKEEVARQKETVEIREQCSILTELMNQVGLLNGERLSERKPLLMIH